MEAHPRTARERRTIAAMIAIYCRQAHGAQGGLCADCLSLLRYAEARLERCPYQERKPTCARCPIHCYLPGMRARVRQVMRCAGPPMLLRYPLLALQHLLDTVRRAPRRPHAGRSSGRAHRSLPAREA